jgi:hypothetical protein
MSQPLTVDEMLNSMLLDMYDCSVANASLSASDQRSLAVHIANRIGRLRATMTGFAEPSIDDCLRWLAAMKSEWIAQAGVPSPEADLIRHILEMHLEMEKYESPAKHTH